jgi:SAM-dependent methyltransferase
VSSTGRIAAFRRRLIPEGVNASLWAYATSDRLAEEETLFFADHPLCKVDLDWIKAVLGNGTGLVADLGCGSGRASAVLADLGWNVLAIDLSRPMLRALRHEQESRAASRPGSIQPLQANLARLDFLPPRSLNAAVCLFSTLGMMPERTARRRFLAGVAAALEPEGKFLLHAHNWWVQKSTGQGRMWMARDLVRRIVGAPDFGNREAHYRGIPGVRIHCFTWPEISSELQSAGFRITNTTNLDAARASDIGQSTLARNIRAGGWLIEAERTSQST